LIDRWRQAAALGPARYEMVSSPTELTSTALFSPNIGFFNQFSHLHNFRFDRGVKLLGRASHGFGGSA
jgi:hypothetical protein